MKNQKIEKDSLIAIGLRSRNIEDLLVTINDWIEETKAPESFEPKNDSSDSVMSLPENFQPKSAWEFFSYKPNKKTGMATWESSYNRFMSEYPELANQTETKTELQKRTQILSQ